MKKWILSFLCLTATLSAKSDDEIVPYLTSEHDALSIIDGLVNTASGQLVRVDHDITIEGSDPLNLTRYYDGGHTFNSDLGYGFGCAFPELMGVDYNRNPQVFLEQRQGAKISFKLEQAPKEQRKEWAQFGRVSDRYYRSGYTNCCEALLRGEPDVAAMLIKEHRPTKADPKHYFKVELGNGTCRYYERYWSYQSKCAFRIYLEKRSNGNLRHFTYTDPYSEHFSKIWTTNGAEDLTLNWIHFDYGSKKDKPRRLKVTASNGQSITYRFVTKTGKYGTWAHNGWVTAGLLEQVESSHAPLVNYKQRHKTLYENKLFQVETITYPDNRQIRVDYNDQDQVERLYRSQEAVPLYAFACSHNKVKVINALGQKKVYTFYEKRRLKTIEEELRTHQFMWGAKGRLKERELLDASGQSALKKSYEYDPDGRIVETTVTGKITNSATVDQYTVQYSYSTDEFKNLIEEVRSSGHTYLYRYQPNSNLVTSKRTMFNGHCVERHFFSYDKNAILIKKVVDDGCGDDINDMANVSCRLETEIEPHLDPTKAGISLPWKIKEYSVDPITRTRVLLKIKERSYTQGSLLAEEKTYDADGNYCFSEKKEYNARRQLISETNAVGEVTHYSYDSNCNLSRKERGGKKTFYFYDHDNHLIEQIEEDEEGKRFSTKHAYDLMGNRIATTDRCNQVTRFDYDALGRQSAIVDPKGHREEKSYDCHNHLTIKTDKAGYTTTTLNNIYGKPLKIAYPDGSEEEFEYNIAGHLTKKVQRNGTYACYQVDYAGRPTTITTYSISGEQLKTEAKTYKGQQLISETDAMGNETTYLYNSAGRLTQKVEPGRTTSYSYDSLGRLHQTIMGDSVQIQEYDHLDRVIEERTEDLEGTLYKKKAFLYDQDGNIIEERVFIDATTVATTKTQYNRDNLPTKITDCEGNTTQIQYRYSDHLEKTTTDAQGRRTVESYDSCNRLLLLKKFDHSEKLLARTTFEYEKRGLLIKRHDDRLFDEKSTYTVEMSYDSMGQKISEVEEAEKTTKYEYEHGKLKTLFLPDGTTLTHRYDPLGRLERVHSSDGTVDYSHSYDLNDNHLISKDLVNHTTTTRFYNALNQLIEERQASGLICHYSYDSNGRITQFSMPDGVALSYGYSPGGLTEVVRRGSREYRYRQTTDWRGRTTQCTLPNGTKLHYSWTPSGYCAELLSPAYSQICRYDPSGNLTHTQVTDALGTFYGNYSYDGLNQLILEEGFHTHTYGYDRLHNRDNKNGLIHTIGSLNQTTGDGDHHYHYDVNGRRTEKNGTRFSYDALGRLIQYEADGKRIQYVYDSFDRRIEKTVGETSYSYLYQLGSEVGTYVNGTLKELKVCHDKRSPFALELDGQYYSCINTPRGDICQLQDRNQQPVATYRYDAFGLFTHEGAVASPWLFSGQRYEFETSLYHFLKRDYDPALGRWLTPDPLGFADGPNLYLYAHNCPLTKVDPDGQFVFALPIVIPLFTLEFGTMAIVTPTLTYIGGAVAASLLAAGTNEVIKYANQQNSIFRKKEGGVDPSLPTDPFNDPEWEDVSHPNAAAAGHHTFKNKKTGETIRYDEGDPQKPGHRKHDHYHRPNPEGTDKSDQYLDAHGEPTSDGSPESHLYPPEWIWW